MKAFFGPFVITFIVSIILFELQFIWLYVDEMMGKGIDTLIIIEVLIYKSSELVSYALPLAILMSSIMTMGNLAENYELAALKSAGVSLFRIMRPLTVLMIVISASAFFFANNIWPIANLKFHTLIYSVTHQKPMLTLEDNVFYTGIDGLAIRCKEKDIESGELTDVVIYDYKNTDATKRVIRAEKGSMQQTDDQRYLVMTLENGVMYDELVEESKTKDHTKRRVYKRPLIKSTFEKDIIRFDLSSLFFVKQDEELFDDRPKMMTISQIDMIVDSLDRSVVKKNDDIDKFNRKSLLTWKYDYDKEYKEDRFKKLRSDSLKKDSIQHNQNSTENIEEKYFGQSEENLELGIVEKAEIVNGDFFKGLNVVQHKRMLKQAREVANQHHNYFQNIVNHEENVARRKRTYNIEFHRKFYLGFSCLVLFFIGAPLGAILRKGGIGYPAIFALVLFMLYYILNVIGERMVKAGSLEAWQGMWMSSIVLFPLGLFLTYKAATDSAIMDPDAYRKFFRKFTFKRKNVEQSTSNTSTL